MTNYPLGRKDNIVVQELQNELLIYDLNTHKAYCLNETSALVWQLCDGTRAVHEISSQVTKKLNISVTEEVVWLALDDLKKNNLLPDGQQVGSDFNGMSRRQVIRKAGLASLVALPLISALVAPTPAMAQSGGGTCANPLLGPPCATDAECIARGADGSGVNLCFENCCVIGPVVPGGGGGPVNPGCDPIFGC